MEATPYPEAFSEWTDIDWQGQMLIHFTADRRYAICGSTSVAIDDQMPLSE